MHPVSNSRQSPDTVASQELKYCFPEKQKQQDIVWLVMARLDLSQWSLLCVIIIIPGARAVFYAWSIWIMNVRL